MINLKMIKSLEEKQKEICTQFGAEFYPCRMNLKVGISRNVRDREMPINGLRIKPEVLLDDASSLSD
jgi:hypothetical protein